MAKVNPFKPNSPVRQDMFVGRIDEIRRLNGHLVQTAHGNPTNFIISGERGIGKSSLLNYAKWVAASYLPVGEENLRFLVIDTDIEPSTTQIALVQKIELGLRRELGKTEPARDFLKRAWEFIQRVEAGGVRLEKATESRDDSVIIEEFAYSLAETINRLTDEAEGPTLFNAKYNGVLILIDEVDRGSEALQIGSFLKLLTERLERRSCDKLSIGLAGLPTIRDQLSSTHASSPRLFDIVYLDRLTPKEINQVIDGALQRAEKDSGVKYTITDDARNLLVNLSEGYPHFVQQFGFSAFDIDRDTNIDEEDVIKSALGKMGALELIGERYYREDFYKKIKGESYRKVLRIMADNLDGWITLEEIRSKHKGKATVLNNAIKALRDRHIIASKEGERGVYRLQQKGFALWIKLHTTNPEELKASKNGEIKE